MIKKISIIIAGVLAATTVSANAQRNPYNEMDCINLTNRTLQDYAIESQMTLEEFKIMHGLPEDMPGDTNEIIAWGHIPLKYLAAVSQTTLEDVISYYQTGYIGTEEITGDTLVKDVEDKVTLSAILGDMGVEEFKVAFGLSPDVNADTPYYSIRNHVDRIQLAASGALSYDDGSSILVMLKGKYLDFDVAPVIENNSVLVPLRNIFTALGAEVSWQGDVQTVIAVRGEDRIAMQVGQNFIFKNNEKIEIPTASIAKDGRVLVPVRAVAEALDTEVYYNANTKTVVIH